MDFLGFCRNYISFIFTLFISISYIDCLGEILPGCKNCFTIVNRKTYNTSKLSQETAESLTKGRKTNATDDIPEASKKLKFIVKGSHPTIVWWTDPRVTRGLDHLRHILLEVSQEYITDNGTFLETEYSLLNVTGNDLTAPGQIYVFNCTKFRPGAYRMAAVMWFLGKLEHSADGRLVTNVNDKSRSETETLGKDDIIPALQKEKREADECICLSTITIRVLALSTGAQKQISARIQGSKIPDDTEVEIQVIREDASGKYLDRSVNVSGRDIQTPYLKKFNISRGKQYYIRVIRHCHKGFYVSCGKDEADVMRSDSVFLESGSSHSPLQSSKDAEDKGTSKNTNNDNDQGMTSRRIATRPTEISSRVIQIAAITFVFGICTLVEVAVIFRLCTALFCHQKKSTTIYKRSAYATLDKKGQTITKLIRRKRVAIIFTKDSREHEERVYDINNELRNRDIETAPFDETTTPELRANWIQAAENVVKKFEAIMFVISPVLYNVCKNEETGSRLMTEERNDADIEIFTKFPAVVLNGLKNMDTWACTRKTKLISVCIAETEHECKQLSIKMRREHPVIFKDKIHFHCLKHTHGPQSKRFQKLINRVISSL